MHRAALALVLFATAAYFASEAEAAPVAVDPAADPDAGNWLDAILGTLELPSMSAGTATRGERNNNPGNIRHGNDWRGEVAGNDAAFESFATPEDGIRALAVVLKNYQRNYGLRTVRQIINRYAPPVENLTGAYAAAVARSMGITVDQTIDLSDAGILTALVNAIIHHENGRNIYSAATVAAGVARA